jgi:hypothetical protein
MVKKQQLGIAKTQDKGEKRALVSEDDDLQNKVSVGLSTARHSGLEKETKAVISRGSLTGLASQVLGVKRRQEQRSTLSSASVCLCLNGSSCRVVWCPWQLTVGEYRDELVVARFQQQKRINSSVPRDRSSQTDCESSRFSKMSEEATDGPSNEAQDQTETRGQRDGQSRAKSGDPVPTAGRWCVVSLSLALSVLLRPGDGRGWTEMAVGEEGSLANQRA